MEKKDKIRVLLSHWIEHNRGHGDECAKWATISRQEGMTKVAGYIDEAIRTMEKTNTLLSQALHEAGGKLESGDSHHHHHH